MAYSDSWRSDDWLNPDLGGTTMLATRNTNTPRTILATLMACMLVVLAACSGEQAPDTDESQSSSPSPTPPPKFSQEFAKPVDGEPATISVGDKPNKRKMRTDNLGISFEATELADPRWDPNQSNLDELLKNLGQPGLRFGGNRLDRSLFWTSSDEKAPKGKIKVTPDDLKSLKKMADTTKSRVTIGIPLGDYDPKRGADMAHHAITILGPHLVGISVGNEPNGYTVDSGDLKIRDDNWNTNAYKKQLRAYVDAITARHPDAPIIGPGAYDTEWMDAFTQAMDDSNHTDNVAAISQHWYPLFDCSSTKVPGHGPQADNFTTKEVHDSAAKLLGMGLDRAKKAKAPLWVEETGPTSCPGSNDASKRFAKTLWTADYTLHAATLGVERLNMHSMLGSCDTGAPMSTVCDPSKEAKSEAGSGAGLDPQTWADANDGQYQFQARDNFLAMQTISPTVGGKFVDTKVSGSDNMRAYTTTKGDTTVTVIINNNDASKNGGNPVTIKMPEGYVPVSAGQLAGKENNTQDRARHTPQRKLPKELPYSGSDNDDASESGAPESATPGASEAPTVEVNGNTLRFDVAASSITTVIWKKKPELGAQPSATGPSN